MRFAMRRTGAVIVAFAALATPSHAAGSKNVQASLLSEHAAVQPGQALTLGLRLEMADGWHTYWKNPADSGLPTKLTWTLPPGFTAEALQWPHPERIEAPPLMSYGYNDEVLLPVTVRAPADLAPGRSVRLAARADWLECKEICLPGKADLEITLPVEAATRPSEHAARFAKTRALLPGDGSAWKPRALSVPKRLVLAFSPQAAPTEAYFFVDRPQVVEYAEPQKLFRTADGFTLELTPAVNGPAPERLSGVLVAVTASGTQAVAVDAAVETAASAPAGAEVVTRSGGSVWAPMGAAFLGGLLLNLMPCVLPVLSLKVLGFVRQAGDRAVWRHGLAFTAGVVLSFWALAGLMLALRAGGESIGWGFQLQSPGFVAVLALLFLLIALNLLGVFEVGMSLVGAGSGTLQGASGLASSFWSGLLATVVATPCTAPFMGSALGFSLGQPGLRTLLVFTALGLGMSAPYLLLSASPRLLRFVPRPGPWMTRFKEVLAVPMLATVVFLAWLLGQQTGVDGMAWLLAAFIPVSLGAWIYGRASQAALEGRPHRGRFAWAGALVLAGVALALVRATVPVAAAPAAADALGWEPFSIERRDALRAQGTPVFIDFTASWCLSCQVNERVALDTPAVRAKLREHGVVLLKADWTRRDDRITEALASYGRQGVPLYVLYGRDKDAPPRLLPEVLTPGIVVNALDEHLGRAQAAEIRR
jgi:thiol:disulfide interchange protein DsbD